MGLPRMAVAVASGPVGWVPGAPPAPTPGGSHSPLAGLLGAGRSRGTAHASAHFPWSREQHPQGSVTPGGQLPSAGLAPSPPTGRGWTRRPVLSLDPKQ